MQCKKNIVQSENNVFGLLLVLAENTNRASLVCLIFGKTKYYKVKYWQQQLTTMGSRSADRLKASGGANRQAMGGNGW